MAPSKAACYTHLLRLPHQDQNYVIFSRRCRVTCTVGLLLFLTIGYIFWPSDPGLKIVRLKVKRIKVHRVPLITVDISMLLTVRVQNADVYSLDFGAVDVEVGYRGKMLGHVRLEHGHVRARGSSNVNADVEFSGIRVLPEMVLLLEDLAKGAVPFDTVSQVRGQLGLLFFHFPIKAKLSCEVLVGILNQTIVRQHCLHELWWCVGSLYDTNSLRWMHLKHPSFSVLYAMNLANCHCLGTRNSSNWPSYVRICYNPIVCVNEFVTRLKMPSWRTLWRKIKREKRRFCSSSPVVHVQYDPSSYSQNFDDGYSTDPDNVSRSFSARFAMPSKIFEKDQMVGDGDI